MTVKNIRYIDSNGTNLLFGNQAIYNPDSVMIKLVNDNTVNVWKQEDLGTIMFNLEKNYTTYYIVLSDSLIDTLEFELAERKSTSCCGNVTYSTKTFLNGQETENNDIIVITHQVNASQQALSGIIANQADSDWFYGNRKCFR